MAKLKTRAQRLAEEWEDRPIQELDPEADQPADNHGADSSPGSEAEDAGTEHYVSVGRSKLRQRGAPPLGPQYGGKRIPRHALGAESDEDGGDSEDPSVSTSDESEDENSGYDDPELADPEADADKATGDAEIDSDEAFGVSDEETFRGFKFRGSKTTNSNGKFKKRPTAADYMFSDTSTDEDKSVEEIDDEHDGSEHEDEDARLESGSDEDQSDLEGPENEDESGDGLENQGAPPSPRALAAQRTLTSNLSDGARKDIRMGHAIQKQRKAFDSLLNLRIRLQKALVAVNSLPAAGSEEPAGPEAYSAAEAAAVRLWHTMDSCRMSFLATLNPMAGKKRKRDEGELTSTEDLWAHMGNSEKLATKYRKATLQLWDQKSEGKKVRIPGADLRSVTMKLEDSLQDLDIFVKRTQTPRSCAPIQQAGKVKADAEIYDDADFYQRLLKQLVDQRSADAWAAPGGAVAGVRPVAAREATARGPVDTRASKGRKMRFKEDEKIQNFTAPEERQTWEQAAVDRFFGTLFGRRLALTEQDESDEDGSRPGAEEEGLRLFRS